MAQPQRTGYEGLTVGWRAGDGGLAVNVNPSRIPVRKLIQAEGVVFYEDDWRKEPGNTLFGTIGSAPFPTVLALHDWHPIEGTQRIVSLGSDGFVYSTSSGSPNNPAAQSFNTTVTASASPLASWVDGGAETGAQFRKCFLFRDNALPGYLNGDTVTLTSLNNNAPGPNSPALDWTTGGVAPFFPPITGLIYGNGNVAGFGGGRLWASGSPKNPYMVYVSKLGDHTDFRTTSTPLADTDFQALSIFPGIGERCYCLRSYAGQVVVFRYPRGIFLIDARSPSPGDWVWTVVSDQIGVAQSPYAAVNINNDILFLSPDGLFYLFSAVLRTAGQPGLQPENLSLDEGIYQYLTQNVDRTSLARVQSVYFPFRQVAEFTFPRPQDSGKNHARINFDFARAIENDVGVRVSYTYRDQAASLALRRDPVDQTDKPMFGDYAGNIVLREQPQRDDRTAPYPFTVQTPHTNLAEFETFLTQKFVQLAHRRKIWDAIELEYIAYTVTTFTVAVYVDGKLEQSAGSPPNATLTVPVAFSGSPLGGPGITNPFKLDVSRLGSAMARSVRRVLNVGSGRRISFTISNNLVDQDSAITGVFVSFRIADEAAPRDT